MSKLPTVREFQARFPTEEPCLDHLMRVRWGDKHQCKKCDRLARYYRVKARRSYECEFCGAQVYPTAGTPFENTRTSLRDWFFVMFLFCASRNGVAAKEVERQIGVTYKTAWRMCREIRKYMGFVDGDATLGGAGQPVEIDEVFLGGHDKMGESDKIIVFGMVERGGEAITRVIPNRAGKTVQPHIAQHIAKGATIYSDEFPGYGVIPTWEQGYTHATVNHAKDEYVRGSVHTNSVEGLWSLLRRGINGTYIHVSEKWLQTYLWEFEFRYNLRKTPRLMLDLLLTSFLRPSQKPLPVEAGQSVA